MPVTLICPHPHHTPSLCGRPAQEGHIARFAEHWRVALGQAIGTCICLTRFTELAADELRTVQCVNAGEARFARGCADTVLTQQRVEPLTHCDSQLISANATDSKSVMRGFACNLGT
jgi:hypothetical protein